MWLRNYPSWYGITEENKTKAGMRTWHCDIKLPWHNHLISLFSPILGSSHLQLNGIQWAHSSAPTSVLYRGTPNWTQCPCGASPVMTEGSATPLPGWLWSHWHSPGHSWLFLQGTLTSPVWLVHHVCQILFCKAAFLAASPTYPCAQGYFIPDTGLCSVELRQGPSLRLRSSSNTESVNISPQYHTGECWDPRRPCSSLMCWVDVQLLSHSVTVVRRGEPLRCRAVAWTNCQILEKYDEK